MNKCVILSISRLYTLSLTLRSELTELGYEVVTSNLPDEEAVNLLVIDLSTTLDELKQSFPWLQEQYDFSSIKFLKLMPFLIYDSIKENVEDAEEYPVGEILEELISGEFKPYGYDYNSPEPLKEFPRVYENYSE